MYKLTENDKQDINILLSLGNSIIENENKLAELEANFQKERTEYKNTLESLKSTLALENNIYSRIGTNMEKILTIISELGNPIETLSFDSQMKYLLNKNINNSNLIKIRIANKLNNASMEETINSKDITVQGFCYDKSNNSTTQFKPESIVKVDTAIKNDLFNAILTFLNKETDNCNDKVTRTNLIKKKYYFAFMNPDIEADLVEDKYEVGELYLTSKAYATIEDLDEKIYIGLKFAFIQVLYEVSANSLFKITKEDLDDQTKKGYIIMLKTILKSALILDQKGLAQKLKEKLEVQMDVFKIEKIEGIKIILDIINNINEDLKEAKVITLNLKKES